MSKPPLELPHMQVYVPTAGLVGVINPSYTPLSDDDTDLAYVLYHVQFLKRAADVVAYAEGRLTSAGGWYSPQMLQTSHDFDEMWGDPS